MTVVCEGPPAIAQKSLARPRVDPFIIFVVRTCTTSLVSPSRHWHVQERYEKRAPQQFKLHYSGSTAWKRKRAYLGAQVFEPATAVVLSYSASPCHEIIAMIDSLSAEKPHG